MKPLLLVLGSALLVQLRSLASPPVAADFTVHEWGTFTSVVGSDGRMLSGLEVEEDHLPNFVHALSGFGAATKGYTQPVDGVTVKMETPVLYFYSDQPRTVQVEVRFHGGAISQWYPERTGGETPLVRTVLGNLGAPLPIDFTGGHEGAVAWQVDVLPRNTSRAVSAPRQMETPQWPRARVAGANLLQNDKLGEVEGFIFYRGIGHFDLPLEVTCRADGTLILRNAGGAKMPFVWVYERAAAPGAPARGWLGRIHAGTAREIPLPAMTPTAGSAPLHEALVAAGLTAGEAAALIDTWRESYFERPGLRIFWIVPRDFTDATLPLTITPRPARLERVLVGRTEVLTPAFESELVRGFAVDGGARWASDRYLLAFRERVRRMGGVVDVAPAARAP